MRELFCSFLLLLTSLSIFGQPADWIADSLEIYKKEMDRAAQQKDTAALIWIQSHVYTQGTKSLSPEIYEAMYAWSEDKRIQVLPGVAARIYHNLGNLEFYRSRIDASKNNFLKALQDYQRAGEKGDAAGMAMNLGIILERSGKYDSAIQSYERAMPIFLEVGDSAAIAVCLENIGLAYQYKGELRKALSYLMRTDSLLQLTTPPNTIRWTYLYNNYSKLLAMMGRYEEALDYAFNGLRISESLNDERQTSIGYVHLQHIYDLTGDEANWMKYVRKALVFSRSSGNGMRIADLEYSLAAHYADKGMLDSATYYAESGMAYYRENDQGEGLGRGYLLAGRIHYEKDEFTEAIRAYDSALLSFDPSSVENSRAYLRLGQSNMRLGNYSQANEYLLKALDMRRNSGELSLIASSYQALAENNRLAGDYEKAYFYLDNFKKYQDSLFNENKTKQMAEIETRYETEKKDQAITALEKDREIQMLLADKRKNQIYLSMGGLAMVMLVAGFFFHRSRIRQRANLLLKEKSDKIARQNAEKETLLKEIHHRVKNNLQIISSLLSMQTRTLQDEQAIDAMKESQSRVKTMALIHEKLYQYDNLSRINMKEYMSQLSEFLAHTYRTDKDIQVVINTDDINLDIDTAVPLGLIANELLSNAWKYAFQEMNEGEIRVNLARNGQNRYSLEIRDTGKGIAEEKDLSQSKSLGLKLVSSLTRQLGGDLEILDQNPGTAFRIEFQELTLVA